MDGGTGIQAFKRLEINESKLLPTNSLFHYVIPGRYVMAKGSITLQPTFSDAQNLQTESLSFDVVNFNNSYNAMIERPHYAKFMAVANYVYLKLKMLGPCGVILVS